MNVDKAEPGGAATGGGITAGTARHREDRAGAAPAATATARSSSGRHAGGQGGYGAHRKGGRAMRSLGHTGNAAALVDRRQGPEDRARWGEQWCTVIPRLLMPGAPAEGGLGLLPLTMHVRARDACWAAHMTL